MKPSYFHFEIPSGRNHGQADVASSYLATITWCAWYPTWRRNVAQRGMCIGIPPPSPLDRCHVVRVFAGGCAWELGYGHRPMSCVHTPCCTHSYAAPPPSYSAVKLLLTFVSFILSIDSCPQPFRVHDYTTCKQYDVNATFHDVSNRQCVFTRVYTISGQTVGQSNH